MSSNRQLFDVRLQPSQGSRFAPTGFPDLGAAEFERPTGEDGWERCLLVESAQSMANRLEATLWDEAADRPIALVEALPYVRVLSDGDFITSSRTESHRLASPYVRNATDAGGTSVRELTVDRLGLAVDKPHDYPTMARALLSLDPLVLLHGVFFAGKGASDYPGQPKFTRVLTAFIEATDVRLVESGGVKRDHVYHTQKASGGDATEGFGSVPFSRTEWTARHITASFNLDLAQLRSYGLPEPAERLMIALAHLEIRRLLSGPLRLRTNCDLEVIDDSIVDRTGTELPELSTIETTVAELARECAEAGLFDDAIGEVTWRLKK